MAAKGPRENITLECTECKRRNYMTSKNKRNNTDRLEIVKYCKFCKKRTTHKKEAKTNKKENNKNKKSFSKDFKAELKKVVWPTPKQLVNNTVAVIAIVLVTAAIVFVLDLTFETLNKHGVNKIKEVVSANNTVTADNTTSNQTTENTNNETSTEDSQNTENTDNNVEENVQ